MNPWASPWDDAADASARAPTPPLALGGTSPPPVSSAALSSLDVDPWGGEASGSCTAAPEPRPVTEVAPVPGVLPDTLPDTSPPTAVDAHLASLTSASLTLHENVWGRGDTMQTAWTDEAPARGKEMPATASGTKDEAEADAEALPPSTDGTATPPEATSLGPERAASPRASASGSSWETPAPAKGSSTLGRLGAAVTEWRKARAAAAEKAKEAAEAEQVQGWKKVAPPKPTTARLAGWLRRGTDSAPTSPARTPTRARSPEKSAAGAPLNDDDLAWLEAASSRPATTRSSMERTAAPRTARGVRRYDANAYDPDPRYDYDPPSTYDVDATERGAAPSPPIAHDPYMYDPDDDADEFGEMQQYTDDGPEPSRLCTYSDKPRLAPPPRSQATTRTPSVDLLSASPPLPAQATTPTPRTTRKGALSDADMNFFETL
ncbi:hypothetical protein MEQU1_001460 [Malassezia equina]|uniref:Uncharacterized protein n=1 Tax=Malassezia equina TaxID=1381935 RepID=A0AAF0EC20_9BASI|nr:hypothetical protein MEQU1_001460 [Malassezia equina]